MLARKAAISAANGAASASAGARTLDPRIDDQRDDVLEVGEQLGAHVRLVAAGVVTVIAGLILASGWPVNSLWLLGLFLAIDLIFQGWSFIIFGFALKKA